MIEINTNRIHETCRMIAGNDILMLDINVDPLVVMSGVNEIRQRLEQIRPEDEVATRTCAYDFASLIFGKTQAAQILAFYAQDGSAVLNAVTQVFTKAIAPRLTAMQETAGRKAIRRSLWSRLKSR